MDALGKTKDQLMPGGRRPISSMVIVFLADLVMAAVLARLIPAMGPTPSPRMVDRRRMLAWLRPDDHRRHQRLCRNPSALSAVASWHWLGVLLVMGLVMGRSAS